MLNYSGRGVVVKNQNCNDVVVDWSEHEVQPWHDKDDEDERLQFLWENEELPVVGLCVEFGPPHKVVVSNFGPFAIDEQ